MATRSGQPGRAAQVRVKRCGKSAPAPGVTRAAWQTPPGARPNVGRLARPKSPGRPHRWMATHPDPGNRPVDRTPPTGRLTVISAFDLRFYPSDTPLVRVWSAFAGASTRSRT